MVPNLYDLDSIQYKPKVQTAYTVANCPRGKLFYIRINVKSNRSLPLRGILEFGYCNFIEGLSCLYCNSIWNSPRPKLWKGCLGRLSLCLVFRRLFNILLRYLREREKEHHGEEALPKSMTGEVWFWESIQLAVSLFRWFQQDGRNPQRESSRGGPAAATSKILPEKVSGHYLGRVSVPQALETVYQEVAICTTGNLLYMYEDLLYNRPESTVEGLFCL